MEVEKNFYQGCKKQAPYSDAGNSDFFFPPIATGED